MSLNYSGNGATINLSGLKSGMYCLHIKKHLNINNSKDYYSAKIFFYKLIKVARLNRTTFFPTF
jgi:hypothetical protein